MITLEQFKSNAIERGICKMVDDWNNANSKKQLMDVCLSAKGMPYVADAIAAGWGVSPEIIVKDFHRFNDGRYVRDMDGYTSAMWCWPTDSIIHVDTTCALIINHKGTVVVDRPITELHIVNSDVIVKGQGVAKVHLYNSTVINPNERVVVESKKEY